jgi:hypothetical protein
MPPQHQSTPIHCNLTLVYHHILSLHASYGLDWGVYGSVQNVSGTDLVPGIGLGQVTPGLTHLWVNLPRVYFGCQKMVSNPDHSMLPDT